MTIRTLYLFVFPVLMLASCRDQTPPDNPYVPGVSIPGEVEVDRSKLPVLDTTIVLSHIVASSYHGASLTDSLARVILNYYYKRKGVFSEGERQYMDPRKDNSDKLFVQYDKIFFADFNNDTLPDAVVSFWLNPIGASGHCYQPHKAIIMDTDNGYELTNEDFIPENFMIDSIGKINGRHVIFGYDYDCGNHQALRRLRITLTK